MPGAENRKECATWSVCRVCGPHAACAMSTCSMSMLEQFDIEIIVNGCVAFPAQTSPPGLAPRPLLHAGTATEYLGSLTISSKKSSSARCCARASGITRGASRVTISRGDLIKNVQSRGLTAAPEGAPDPVPTS